MIEKKKLTKTLVIRITDDQYGKLIDSVKRIPNSSKDDFINRSQVIREMMDKYLIPKCRS